ncbi:MAG TPA: 2-phospho-L-lactate guanylyltransferase [Dermatophilaceae bacterium]|nr:2-phospho-L-lactate guanylyltransferase [Dermatophilaceae bacterium]
MDVPSTEPSPNSAWCVVIPVKEARTGKSRLAATVPDADEQLRRAIADDTVRAAFQALGADGVVVVTSDRVLAAAWATAGVTVHPDPDAGLNAAVAAGLSMARHTGRRTAALLGDLPALTPADLLAALTAAGRHPDSFVPDRDGTGTVLRCGEGFVPRFGPGSAAAHERDGAMRLSLDLPRLRTDVDDRDSLLLAEDLGLGPSTKSALRRIPLG